MYSIFEYVFVIFLRFFQKFLVKFTNFYLKILLAILPHPLSDLYYRMQILSAKLFGFSVSFLFNICIIKHKPLQCKFSCLFFKDMLPLIPLLNMYNYINSLKTNQIYFQYIFYSNERENHGKHY